MQITAPRPVTAAPASWNPNAGRGAHRLPGSGSIAVGSARLPFAPGGPAYAFGGGFAQAIRGVEIFIEAGGAMAPQQQFAELARAFEHVPQALLDNVRQLRILARQDTAYDRYFERAYGIPGFQAVAAGGGGSITMFGGRPYTEGVLFHELGHNLSLSSREWRDAVRTDDAKLLELAKLGTLAANPFEFVPDPVRRARWSPRLAPGAVTPYGASAIGEDIAEALHLLMSERRFGHGFASITDASGATRALTFGEAYAARTRVLERAARVDLDGDGDIGA